MLPVFKSLFLCYSQENRNELLELLSNRVMPVIKRKEPSLKDFLVSMDEFVKECKENPDKDYLLLQVNAGHGYHAGGFQEFLSAYLDKETLTHEFIPVEKIVRGYLK